MASQGTRGTMIAFGGFEISVSMKRADFSRDIKTEVVDEFNNKVSMGGGGGGRRKLYVGESRAVRLDKENVLRLPQDELDAIEQASKEQWGTMQVLEVIDRRDVPSERLVGHYWLQPANGSVKGLATLAWALRDTEGVLVVKWVATSREKLGIIRVRLVGPRRKLALLLSEVVFANDFSAPDEDALAINTVEVDVRSRAVARDLLDAFSRDGERKIDTASDSAVDARLALVGRLSLERTDRQLAATEEAMAADGEVVAEPTPVSEAA